MTVKRFMILSALAIALAAPAWSAAQDAVLEQYKTQAAAADGAFAGFSAEHGKAFFLSTNTGGGADTPSCTSCHTSNPVNAGQTRAGKAIEPMAVSASPGRFTDFAKTEKWFTRNCKTVLGRECTPQEKGDFITYMSRL